LTKSSTFGKRSAKQRAKVKTILTVWLHLFKGGKGGKGGKRWKKVEILYIQR
jgi:hypothetical protein